MTIGEILKKLSEQITEKIAQTSGVNFTIEQTNIATLNDGDDFLEGKSPIIISVVNIEEDKTLKNQTLYKEYPGSGISVEKYKKPAQNLILSLLFTSYNKDQAKYADGLDKLELIIRYLQHNNVYYYDNNLLKEQTIVSETETKLMNKIILDLVSLKSEQLNQMWSYLGSKYMPSVLYTMRMIHVQNEDNLPPVSIIDKAKIQLWTNDKTDFLGEIEASSFLLDTEI